MFKSRRKRKKKKVNLAQIFGDDDKGQADIGPDQTGLDRGNNDSPSNFIEGDVDKSNDLNIKTGPKSTKRSKRKGKKSKRRKTKRANLMVGGFGDNDMDEVTNNVIFTEISQV